MICLAVQVQADFTTERPPKDDEPIDEIQNPQASLDAQKQREREQRYWNNIRYMFGEGQGDDFDDYDW